VLDAVRAAKELPALTLADRTVVWGRSQGGHAALWTGILAPSYAPDAHVVGVAALAPASDLAALAENLSAHPTFSIFASYMLIPYGEIYPDVHVGAYLRPGAAVIARQLAGRCLAEPEVYVSIGTSLVLEISLFAVDPGTGALGARLKENTPHALIAAPLLIAQGLSDPLVLPNVQEQFVKQRCAAGQSLEYRTYKGRDHVGVVAPDSPLISDLICWTQDRFAGGPQQSGCQTIAQ
jgi:alpha-beta hydrolase superfamily lysophospholipase